MNAYELRLMKAAGKYPPKRLAARSSLDQARSLLRYSPEPVKAAGSSTSCL